MPGSCCCYRHASAACDEGIVASRPMMGECLFPCQDIARWPVKFAEQTCLTMGFLRRTSSTVYNIFSSADCSWLLRRSISSPEQLSHRHECSNNPDSAVQTRHQTDFLGSLLDHFDMCETITVVIRGHCGGCSTNDSAHTFKAAACYYLHAASCVNQYPDYNRRQTYEASGGHDAWFNGILCDGCIAERVWAQRSDRHATDCPPFTCFPVRDFQIPAVNGA